MRRAATILIGLVGLTGGLAAAPLVLVAREVPVTERAVGTVRARTEAQVMAQASGRLLEVAVREGSRVEAGQVLARIDDRELALRLSQARRGVEAALAGQGQAEQAHRAAGAALAQARSEHERVKGFQAKGAATPQQLEAARSAFQQAEAGEARAAHATRAAAAAVKRAEDAVAEVEVLRRYTLVEAPIAGTVAARLVEPGDLAWPGRPLLRLHTPDELLLEAHVREGLVGRLRPGDPLAVRVDALGVRLEGRVLEVVPLADPVSRKFTVKVGLPATAGLVPGMFGRLEIAVGTRSVVLVPERAVRRRGQLTVVSVAGPAGTRRRLVRLGETHRDGIEVLSGLREGEAVELEEGAP